MSCMASVHSCVRYLHACFFQCLRTQVKRFEAPLSTRKGTVPVHCIYLFHVYIYSRENNYLLHLFLNNATLQIPSLVTIVWSGLEKRPMSSRGIQKYLPTEGTRSYNHRSRYSRSRTRFHVMEERDTWIIK